MSQTATVPDVTTIKGIDVTTYLTDDPVRAIAYYRDVLGLEPSWIDEQGRGAEFTLADGTTFGLWKDQDTKAPGAVVMFSVGDAQKAVAHFRSKGAQITDAEDTGHCYMAFGSDPDGNAYIIHQLKG